MQGFDQELQIYNRQLKQGFSGLRFSPELETEFRVFYHSRNVVKQRGAIIVGVILLLALVPLDLLFIHDARALTNCQALMTAWQEQNHRDLRSACVSSPECGRRCATRRGSPHDR